MSGSAPSTFHLIILALLWLIYCALHSLLASLWMKRWVADYWPALAPAYRLVYNGLAVVLLLPPLVLTLLWQGSPLWAWRGVFAWLANLLAALAALGFALTLRYYAMDEFVGLRQWRQGSRSVEDQAGFRLSPLHRYVRHPWYSLGLVIIWTRDMDPAFLLAACAFTVYFIVGSRLEERKLLAFHGEVYCRYRERVPALIPLPWKFLRAEEAARLTASGSSP